MLLFGAAVVQMHFYVPFWCCCGANAVFGADVVQMHFYVPFLCGMFAGISPELPISPEMLIHIHFGREIGLLCQKISKGHAKFFGQT
jgi:hypothetical protein